MRVNILEIFHTGTDSAVALSVSLYIFISLSSSFFHIPFLSLGSLYYHSHIFPLLSLPHTLLSYIFLTLYPLMHFNLTPPSSLYCHIHTIFFTIFPFHAYHSFFALFHTLFLNHSPSHSSFSLTRTISHNHIALSQSLMPSTPLLLFPLLHTSAS